MTKINNISTTILIVCILSGIITAATTISDTTISVDNFILGGQTIVAYTAALNTKLSGIETLADVTDATNVDAAGALMESNIPDQSFTNLLVNYDFESWSGGAAAAPDGWYHGGAGSSIACNTTEYKNGVCSAALTRGAAGDAYLRQEIPSYKYYQGRTLTLGCWIKSSVGASIRLHDGVSYTDAIYTGAGAWKWTTATHTMDAAATYIRYELKTTTAGTAYFDNAILVEGLVCPAASPKPIVDDGIMLQEHTPSSASDYGIAGQWCHDNDYIYVCNATDTWIRGTLSTW